MTNPRIVMTLGLVFLAGVAVGMAAMRFGLHDQLHGAVAAAEEARENGQNAVLEHFRQELDLTPEQTEKLALVLDDYQHYYQSLEDQIEDLRLREQIEDLRSTGKSRILEILNPDQRVKFEQMSAEMAAPGRPK
jgi:uncharacterized membrane-anchored protein YhcB (DUF1043 family)